MDRMATGRMSHPLQIDTQRISCLRRWPVARQARCRARPGSRLPGHLIIVTAMAGDPRHSFEAHAFDEGALMLDQHHPHEGRGLEGDRPAATAQPEGENRRGQRGLQRSRSRVTRRGVVQAASGMVLASVVADASQASKLPAVLDRAWTTMGGGPADLFFPEQFLGSWEVASTLVKVDLPLGPEFVPDLRVVDRAKREDLNNVLKYDVSFIRNRRGEVVTDRRFNTASLLEVYVGRQAAGEDVVEWSPDDPNILTMSLPGGAEVLTRVTRRSLDQVGRDRLNTSEFFQQVFQVPRQVQPRVKASQCFTKYKWRDLEAAELDGGPAIVATQVVSDFLTPDDGEQLMMRAGDKPVVQYTYTMAFFRKETRTAA